MSEPRIDSIARSLARGLPRRRVIGGLVAGLAAPVLARSRTEAACKSPGRKCDKNQDCCDGADCKGGDCKCKNGDDACDGRCVDLDKDEKHCGRCNRRCGGGETCRDGRCKDGGPSEGRCAAGANSCSNNDPVVGCTGNVNCGCVESTDGATRCADFETAGNECGQCETTADCASFGPNAFCARSAPGCCPAGAPNACLLPCLE